MERTISRASRASNNANTNISRRVSDELSRVHTSQSFDDHANYYRNDVDDNSPEPPKEPDLEKGELSIRASDCESDAAKEEAHRELDEKIEEKLEKNPPPDASGGNPPAQEPDAPKDPLLVTWEGPDDPANPKNWPMKRKWAAAFVVSSFTFISPVSSSMVAPALSVLSKDLGITTEFESAMVLSIFVLAYAVGPLFLGPLSEIYGRTIVLQLANLIYLVFNLACGFSRNSAEMLAFRFLSGLGGSAPLAIGGGVLGDCFRPEQRGKAIGFYALMPLLGPAIGKLIVVATNTANTP
jgi:Major Facilitator Superfamily